MEQPQTSTSPTLLPEASTPTGPLEEERLVTSGGEETLGTADLDIRSVDENSVNGPPQAAIGSAPPLTAQGFARQHQQGMLYPSTEAVTLPVGEQQMLYFNPAAAGYSNSSQGYDPREGYPVVYPYVPLSVPREKKKKGYCC